MRSSLLAEETKGNDGASCFVVVMEAGRREEEAGALGVGEGQYCMLG